MVTSVDIANRALQRVGSTRIVALTDNSTRAAAVNACYDILRRAELRRNVWRFAVRRVTLRAVDTTTVKVTWPVYSATKTYPSGAVVSFNGFLYESLVELNLGNQPDQSFSQWTLYFGNLIAHQYDTSGGTQYATGELIYTPANEGYAVYRSLVGNNQSVPTTVAPAYDVTNLTTYNKGDSVTSGGIQYQSMFDLNLGNAPAATPAVWASGTTYATSNTVLATDYNVYTSVGNGNLGNNPVTDGGVHWTLTSTPSWVEKTKITGGQTDYALNQSWLLIPDATVARLIINYPAGVGPSSQQGTRQLFILPSGFVREAPQDPKAGANSQLGAPSGLMYADWTYENNMFVSWDTGPIYYRFAADVSDTTQFDPLFVEGLGSRIAFEICEPLTQSATKLQAIGAEYKQFMGDARAVNGIETGATEPPEDDYVSCRI